MPINKLKTTSIEIDAITADLLATGSITVADISDGEITAAKLHTTLDFSTKTFTMHNNHITQAMVTQHQGALSVTESQINDLQSYALASAVPTDSEIDTRADARITNALAGNVTITGNLTVNGTQTVLNTETLTVDDNIIVLNNNEAGTPSQNAGIEIERGTSTNVDIRWNETTDTWQFTNDGTTYTDIGSGGGATAYTIDTKTDNYTAVADDLGKLIHFTSISADKTLTLTAASTLGAGWFCFVRYSAIASGAAGYAYKVIIDPNGSETIDGETTRKMKGGQTFQILCDGSNFHILSSDESRAFSHNVFYNGVGTHGQSFAQPEASGAYAIALGGAALSSGTGAVALGYDSKATGSHSFAGPNSTATGLNSVGLGHGSPAGSYNGARGSGSVAIGLGTVANATGSLAIGHAANATGQNASAIGHSLASGQHAFAAGITSNSSSYGATGANSVAIGKEALASASNSVAIGQTSVASGTQSIALGYNAKASYQSIAGPNSNASGGTAVAFGIGNNTTTYGAKGDFSFAGGFQATASGDNSIAIGLETTASGTRSVVIGYASTSSHNDSIAIGDTVSTTATNQIALGSSADTVRISSAYTLPTADGASGQVLQTNGSGVLSFATAGGGGATSAYAKFTYEISATVNSVSGADTNGNTLSYSAGNNVVEVFVNGVKQQEGSGKDYQATTGSSVVFTDNLYSGDLVDVVAYNMFDGGDFNFDGSGNLVFGDNKKAIFGTGNDLQIYWDGQHGRIENTAGGNLYLTAYQVNFGDDVFFAGASYDAFWDRSVNSFRFNDNAKAVFGTDSDLIIQHDGSRSIIQDNGTGNLRIQANNLELKNADNTHDYIFCENGGVVQLYHNNSAKLYTQSHGVRIDGGLRFASSGSASDTSNPYIYRQSGVDNMVFATGSTLRMIIDSSGNVGIGDSSPSAPLDVKGSGALGYPANGVDLPAGRRINLYDGNQDHMIGMGNDGMFFTGNTAIRFQYKSGTNAANGTNQLTVDMLNGRIGVGGVATPGARIEVASTQATNTTSVSAISGGSINTLGGDTVTGRLFWKGQNNGGTDLYGVNNESTGLTIYNYTDGKYRIFLKNDGYTGIGTNQPNGALDVEWSANTPANGIYLKNTNTGTNAFTGTYYGNTSSDTDAFVGLNGTNNTSYGGSRSFLLGTNSSAPVAIMVGGTQVHTVAQAPSTSADGYSLTTPALTQTNQLYNMSGTILFDTINNNGLYQPMDYANAIKRYADIGSPTFRGSASQYHNSHSGSVFNSTWCANRELFDMRAGVHFWRVPKSGTYTLTARGAGYNNNGGAGISLTMDYVLYAGEWLRVICGAQGESNYSNHMGGCGATAFSVYRQGIHVPVLIAGGGAGITPNSPGGTNSARNATAPTTYGNHNPYVSGHYGARDGMGGHGSIYQHNYGTYILNWGGGGGGGWATPGGNGGIGINMMEQMSGGRALSEDCPHGGYYQNGNAYHGGFGGGGASGISSGAAGGGGGWYGGNSSYSTDNGGSDDTSYMGGGSYAAGTFTNNGAHTQYGQALIQI